MAIEFEWDAAKADVNVRKHGVSFEEAATAFADPLSAMKIRLISARFATRRERRQYEASQ